MSNLSLRVLTAIFGLAVFLFFLFQKQEWGIQAIILVVSSAALFEYGHMAFQMKKDRKIKQIVLMIAGLQVNLSAIFHWDLFSGIIWAYLLLWGTFLYLVRNHKTAAQFRAHVFEMLAAGFGVSYIVVSLTYAYRVWGVGVEWLLLFFAINWAGDTGAYFAGRAWGKKKLYPLVSPKKTVEGALGGLAASLLAAVIVTESMSLIDRFGGEYDLLSYWHILALTLAVAVVAQVGDFCESLLKRAFQVKDSGGLLPGHGGFLDRFDGVILSMPVMAEGLILVLR